MEGAVRSLTFLLRLTIGAISEQDVLFFFFFPPPFWVVMSYSQKGV